MLLLVLWLRHALQALGWPCAHCEFWVCGWEAGQQLLQRLRGPAGCLGQLRSHAAVSARLSGLQELSWLPSASVLQTGVHEFGWVGLILRGLLVLYQGW